MVSTCSPCVYIQASTSRDLYVGSDAVSRPSATVHLLNPRAHLLGDSLAVTNAESMGQTSLLVDDQPRPLNLALAFLDEQVAVMVRDPVIVLAEEEIELGRRR